MKKFITSFLWTIILIFAAISCKSTDEEPPKPSVDTPIDSDSEYSEEDLEMYNISTETIRNLIDSDKILTFEDAIEATSNMPNYERHEMKDGILTVYFTGGLYFEFDLDGVSSFLNQPDDYVDEEIDVKALANDIMDQLGLNTAQPISTEQSIVSPKTFPQSRTAQEPTLLTKRNILVWECFNKYIKAPPSGDINMMATILNELTLKGTGDSIKVDVVSDDKYSFYGMLNAMKNFDKYDLVVMISHGSSSGDLLVQWSEESSKYNPNISYVTDHNSKLRMLGTKLKESTIQKYLPKDLSKTIIWTCMCYAGRESFQLRKAAVANGVADFYGGTETVWTELSLFYLKKFYTNWINGKESAKALFGERKYKKYDTGKGNGYWTLLHPNYKSLTYCRSTTSKVKGYLSGVWASAEGVFKDIFNISRGSSSDARLGFYVQNDETGEANYYYLDTDNIDSDKTTSKTYEEISAVNFVMKEGIVPPGKYHYRTFVDYGNGNIELSASEEELIAEDSKIIEIYTNEQWLEILDKVHADTYPPKNNFEGYTIKLMADITSNGYIYTNLESFEGTFDGQGNTLTLTNIPDIENNENYPFLYGIGPKGCLKNLNVNVSAGHTPIFISSNEGIITDVNVIFNNTESMGGSLNCGFIRSNYGTVSNCSFSGKTSTALCIIFDNSATVSDCTFNIECFDFDNPPTSNTTPKVQGIIGYNSGTIDNIMVNCNRYGPFTSNFREGIIKNSEFHGKFKCIDTTFPLGSIIAEDGTIQNVKNYIQNVGENLAVISRSGILINVENYSDNVCISGSNSQHIENCINRANKITKIVYLLSSKSFPRVAGIALSMDEDNSVIKNCINYANISIDESVDNIGGIICETAYNSNILIENCINYGNITSPQKNNWTSIGGICGDNNAPPSIQIINCENKGVLTGTLNSDWHYNRYISQINPSKESTSINCKSNGSIVCLGLNGSEIIIVNK